MPADISISMRRIEGLGLGFRITHDVFYKAGTPEVLYSIIRPINATPILREMGKDLKAYEAS